MDLLKNLEQPLPPDQFLGKFLTLSGVLLRYHPRKVIGSLIATSASSLLPNLTTSGFLACITPTSGQLYLQVQGNLLSAENLANLSLPLQIHLLNLEKTDNLSPYVWELPEELATQLKARYLYCCYAVTPTQHYGWLLGGSNTKLSPPELKYFEALASVSSISLESSIRFEDMQYSSAETALLNQIAGEMAASLNAEELFQSYLNRLSEVLLMEQVNMYLSDGNNLVHLAYIWTAQSGRVRRRYSREISIEGNLLEYLFQHKAVIANPEIQDETLFPSEMQSRLIIPLLNRGEVYGLLTVAALEENQYQENKVPLLFIEKLTNIFTPALVNSRRYEEKQYLADIDERVGTYNHNYFERELPMQVEKARRLNYRLGLLIVDMDNLKEINTKYNYLIGSAALKRVAELITHCVRRTDIVARYGGDEFGVLLPGCSQQGLEIVSETIRRAINDSPLLLNAGATLPITVSVGAALFREDADNHTELFEKANNALLIAKQHRNEVRIGPEARLAQVNEEDIRRGEPERFPVPGLDQRTSNNLALGTPETVLSDDDFERFINWLGADKPRVSAQLMNEFHVQLRELRFSLDKSNERLNQLETGLRRGLLLCSLVVEQHEPYLKGITEKTLQLSKELARRVNCTPEEISALEDAIYLSNLGRLGISDALWLRSTNLSEAELEQIRKVPIESARLSEILGTLVNPKSVLTVRHCRERYDGAGYPAGLAGNEIPLLSRILGLASALVAMQQWRPHRPARTYQQLEDEVRIGAGRQFDPELAHLALKILKEQAVTTY